MRLLFLSNVFPNPVAPTKGTFNGALVNALAEEHDVHVVCPVSWTDQLAARVQRGLRCPPDVTPLGDRLTVRYPTFYYPPKFARARYADCLAWSLRRALAADVARVRPDAVVSYWAHPDGAVAGDLARRLGVPAVAMVGGSDVLLLGREGARRREILKTLQKADAVVAVSQDLANQLVRDGLPNDKLHVIRRGVDRTLFHAGDQAAARARLGLPTDRRILVAVGRLVPVKAFDVLVQACDVLTDRGTPIACYILGSGPLAGPLQQQIQRLGLQEVVHLQGGQSQHALADWYRAADATVLSSLSEGVPNVLMESLACGTPFVATRVGGVAEIADDRFHPLVPPQDPLALADAIADRLQQPSVTTPPRFVPGSWTDAARRLTGVIEACRTTNWPGAGLLERLEVL